MLHEWSGERLETFVLNETAVEHLHRYAIAMAYVRGKKVLDIACGEGYGAAFLADAADHVTGIDIDEPTIIKAAAKYGKPNLIFRRGDVRQIPLPAASVDAVVSFETLEHITEHEQMLSEIKRVLRPDGLLLISTPEKKLHSDVREVKSRFHAKELYADEFKALMQRRFIHARFWRQSSFFTSAVFCETGHPAATVFFEGDYNGVKEALPPDPVFIIALASDQELDVKNENSFFKGSKIFYDAVKEHETAVFDSLPYRTGRLILAPLKWVRDIFKQKR